MTESLLFHEGFESDAGWHHNVRIFPVDGESYDAEKGNLFVPKDWCFFFRHQPGIFDQPEAHYVWDNVDPRRIHTGNGAFAWFSFHRRHDAGLMRQVLVERGARLRLTAWMTAWSNGCDVHLSDAKWSDGSLVGYKEVTLTPSDIPSLNGDEQSDANGNSAQMIGIDPTGGTDPYAPSVIWSETQYTYNNYVEQLVVEAVAEGDIVTVFIRDVRLWAFRHNDLYLDDVRLEVMCGSRYSPEAPLAGENGVEMTIESVSYQKQVEISLSVVHESGNPIAVEFQGEHETSTGWFIRTWLTEPVLWHGKYALEFSNTLDGLVLHEAWFLIPDGIPAPDPEPCWGVPRTQYERTYYLLPPGAGSEWAKAIVDAVWDSQRPTIGGSADDAGLGALDYRRVFAVNPGQWEPELTVGWFDEHYAGVNYVIINADTPEQLRAILRA